MICKECGREITQEDAHYCYYCGSSLLDGPAVQRTNDSEPLVKPSADSNIEEIKEIDGIKYIWDRQYSLLTWIGIMVLQLIPFIGQIGYVVILCMLAFGKGAKGNIKNFAIASLIYFGISIIVAIELVAKVLPGMM